MRKGSVVLAGSLRLVAAIALIVALRASIAFAYPGSWIQEAKLTAGDGAAFDGFGVAVAISGNTAVVGSYFASGPAGAYQGAAYVYVRSGGVWTQQQKLTPLDAAEDDNLGVSVAVSGDTAVIGANLDDDTSGIDQGSVYVFVRSGGVWTQQQKLMPADPHAFENFGTSVAISGNYLIAGSPYASGPAGFDQGAAYVFFRSGGVWTQQQKLTPSDAAAGDSFGFAVAMDGSSVVVGAPYDNGPAGSDQGSAYVFTRSGTTWTQQQKLTASNAAAFDEFGRAVAISGDRAVVGAPYHNGAAGFNQGAAYIFLRTGNSWTERTALVASDAAANDYFGWSVAVSVNTLMVGAFRHDQAGGSDQGAVYWYSRRGQNWTQESKLFALDGLTGDNYGYSVAFDGDGVVVGAINDDGAGGIDQGSAYIARLTFPCCPGDMDISGTVDAADGPLLADVLLSANPTQNQTCAADVNVDTRLDGRDLQAYVAKLLAATPCP